MSSGEWGESRCEVSGLRGLTAEGRAGGGDSGCHCNSDAAAALGDETPPNRLLHLNERVQGGGGPAAAV